MNVPEWTDTQPAEHLDHRLEASHRNLERALGWVTLADNKALIALTFQGAIIAGMAVTADPLRTIIEKNPTHLLAILIIILLAAFFGSFCFSILGMFRAISPRITPGYGEHDSSSLFFFGGIAHMDPDVFVARMNDLDPNTIHDGLVKVTHTTAQIALAKFANLRRAYTWLGIQMVTFVFTLVLSVIRPFA